MTVWCILSMFRLFTLRAPPLWQLFQYWSWAILSLAYWLIVCAWLYPVWHEPPVSDYSQGCIPHTSFKVLSGPDSPLLDTPESLLAWCVSPVTLLPAHTTLGWRHWWDLDFPFICWRPTPVCRLLWKSRISAPKPNLRLHDLKTLYCRENLPYETLGRV